MRNDGGSSGGRDYFVEEDFGHVLSGSTTGIIHPRTPGELADAVRDAVASGSKLTLRGLAHSAGGQALPPGSVVVDLSQMNAVGPIDPQRRSFAEWFFPLQVSLEYVDAAPELPAALSPFRMRYEWWVDSKRNFDPHSICASPRKASDSAAFDAIAARPVV